MSELQIFQAGDKVTCAFFGDEVFCLTKAPIWLIYPLQIESKNYVYTFTEDGRADALHTHPVLTLVERPKKKVKRTYWFMSCEHVLGGERYSTGLTTMKDSLNGVAVLWRQCNKSDIQTHSVEIEEDE